MTARDRRILMVIGGLAVLAGFWFLALRPKHAAAKEAAAEIVTQQKRLQTAQQTVATGLQAKAGYPRDYATIAELGKALPKDDDLPSLLYQLNAGSHHAHVEFDSLVRSQAAPGSSGASGASGSDSGSSTASAASAALPPGATVGTAGLGTLPFTFKFSGSYFDLQRLLADVQGFVRPANDSVSVRGRLLTVDGVSLTPGADGLSKIEAKVVATAYLSPETQDPKATTGSATGGTTSPGPSDSASAARPASSTSAITAPSN
jgi:Tfp pilus assembly protein PilO